jgi:predicted nucleic acid-binding protein
MRLVVDANVVVQLQISGGELGPLSGHELVGPPLVMAEATSSIREQVYRGEIPPDRGRGFVAGLADLPITILEPDGLRIAAWDVSIDLGWAKTYDAEYVALALLLACPIVSLDLRMQRGASRLVRVITPTEL